MARIRGFEELVRNSLEDLRLRQPDLDTKPGAVLRDFLDVLMARLSETYSVVSETSKLQSIFSVSGSDLDNIAANFGLTRQSATTSFGTATLTTNSLEADIPIPIGSKVIAVNGNECQVTSGFTMSFANKNVYSANATKNRVDLELAGINDTYAINVPVESISTGISTNISKFGLRRTDVAGMDNVTNLEAFGGGAGSETDEQLRRRIVLSLSGNNTGTKDGLESIMLSNDNVVDVYVAIPGDSLLQRDGTIAGTDLSGNAIVVTEGTGGKVDIYIYGTIGSTTTDSFIYRDVTGGGVTDSGNDRILGTGGQTQFSTSLNRRRLAAFEVGGSIPTQPIVSIISISGSESGSNFMEEFIDTDGQIKGNYELVKDSSMGQGGSPFGGDKLHFISSEIDIDTESTTKGITNGQDALVGTDVTKVIKVTQDVTVLNESSAIESSRNIIRTLHSPIKNVSKVFNATTGERYVISNQNVDGVTGNLNETGRIQISGQTFPAVTDVLQVNYTWNRPYDSNIDFNSLTSLLSTEAYSSVVQDSVDWGFSNTIIENTLPITISGDGSRQIFTTYNVSRVISIKQSDEELYDIVNNSGSGFANNIITLPTSIIASGTANVEYVANLTNIIPETLLSTLPISKDGNGFDKVSGIQPITIEDNILTSVVTYSGSILPQDNLNPWALFTISGTSSPAFSNTTVDGKNVLVFSNSSTAGFYFRTEDILASNSEVDFSVNMRMVDAAIGNSWTSDVGFYVDDGTYQMRFVFFTTASGTKKIGLLNSLAAGIFSADAEVDFTQFHTYKIEKNGNTDVRLYVDDVLKITAIYNVVNFITTINSKTMGFGYFDDATPVRSEWELANYSISTISSVEKPLRFAPTQLKCRVDDIPGNGVLIVDGSTLTKVEQTLTVTEDFNLDVDLSKWSNLSNPDLNNVNFKIGKVESIQKIGSDGDVLVDYDIVGDVDDLSKEYTFNDIPNEEDNPWQTQFDNSDEVNTSISNSVFILETTGTSSSGPTAYFRTEDHFRIGNIIKATFRMKIEESTLETISGTTTLDGTGVTIWIKNSNVFVPLTFLSIGGVKYMAIIKDTSKVSQVSDAYVLYPIDWSQFFQYEFEIDKESNVSVSIDSASPSISIPYIESQLFSADSFPISNITNEAIIFGHADNRVTKTHWDFFNYESKDAERTKYSIKDNFYDLRLSEELSSLDRFTVRLPDTSINSNNSISIGNSIKTIFYYVKENDLENIRFTSDGTQYTDKIFGLVDKIRVSSGFTSSNGIVNGSLTINSANQPESNITYFTDYSYTAPKQGERITIQYSYNKLIGNLSSSLETLRSITSDVLIKEANSIAIDVEIDIVPEAGFNLAFVTLQQNVQNSIINLLTSEELGTTLDSSDIIDVVYNNAGVDKSTLISFNLTGEIGIRSSIIASGNEYLSSGIIVVNLKDRSGNSLV